MVRWGGVGTSLMASIAENGGASVTAAARDSSDGRLSRVAPGDASNAASATDSSRASLHTSLADATARSHEIGGICATGGEAGGRVVGWQVDRPMSVRRGTGADDAAVGCCDCVVPPWTCERMTVVWMTTHGDRCGNGCGWS